MPIIVVCQRFGGYEMVVSRPEDVIRMYKMWYHTVCVCEEKCHVKIELFLIKNIEVDFVPIMGSHFLIYCFAYNSSCENFVYILIMDHSMKEAWLVCAYCNQEQCAEYYF